MLLEEEEEKVKDDEQEKRAEEEVEDGADLLSTQEDNTHGQYLGREREVLEQDHHRIQMPIRFVENETVEMVSTNDGTILIGRIPNEILEKILSEALLSSGFSWPNHVCRMYNNLCQVNARFCRFMFWLMFNLCNFIKDIYVIHRPGGPYWEKLCPRSRVRPEAAGRGPYSRQRAQFFPIRTDQGR